MTKLNTRGLDAELSHLAHEAWYTTIEELEFGIARAQAILAEALLESTTPEQARKALRESVLAKLQRIRAHHYEVASVSAVTATAPGGQRDRKGERNDKAEHHLASHPLCRRRHGRRAR